MNNIVCSVLADAGTPYIYCVGGSAGGATTATGRVFRYNPVTDVISPVAAPWPPGSQNVLPGGFAVVNNKLYIMGGFQINTQMINQTWSDGDSDSDSNRHGNCHSNTIGKSPYANAARSPDARSSPIELVVASLPAMPKLREGGCEARTWRA